MIPLIQHRLWVGPPLPDHYAEWIDRWEATHPDWEHRLWTEADLVGFFNQDLIDRRAEISPTAASQFVSDVARYEILWRFGGVWVDADFEPRRSIEPLCVVEAFVGWEVQDRWASNAIMGAVPEHPFIGDLIEGLPASVERNQDQSNTKKTGPQYLTPILGRHLEVTVYDQAMFFPYAYNELERAGEDFGGAYAVHHWGNQRRKRGIPL